MNRELQHAGHGSKTVSYDKSSVVAARVGLPPELQLCRESVYQHVGRDGDGRFTDEKEEVSLQMSPGDSGNADAPGYLFFLFFLSLNLRY